MTRRVRATGAESQSLTEQTSRGMVFGVGGAVLYQAYSLVVQTALTYLLSKSQFGAYGKAFALVSFSMLLQQLGFTEVLLRRRGRLRLWRSQVAWFALALGVAGSLLLVAAAFPAASLYQDPRLVGLILLAAPLPIIRSLTVFPVLELMSGVSFVRYYALLTGTAMFTLTLTWVLALAGLGERSFVVSTLIAETGFAVILWRTTRMRISSAPKVSAWSALGGRLRFVLGANVARWVRVSIDPLILGLFATPSAVGVYFFGQSMVGQIVRVVTLNLSGILLPALNKIEGDPARQTAAFLRACRVLGLVGVPMCVGLAVVADLFVRVFLDYGKWHALPPVIAALAVGTAFRLLDEPTQSLLSAQGRFRTGFWVSVAGAVLYTLICAAGSLGGDPLRTAIAVAFYGVFWGPGVLALAIRFGGGTTTESLKIYLVPFALSMLAIVPWQLVDRGAPGAGRARDVAVLAVEIIGAGGTYAALCAVLRPPGWHELLDRLGSLLPGRRADRTGR